MFIYDFIQVELPFDLVRDRLLSGGGAWLSRLATEAQDSDRYPAVRIPVQPTGGVPITKQVVVQVDRPYENDGLVRIPFRWHATGPGGIFPDLDGDIELARLDAAYTHICVMGHYDPPLGAVGRVLDRIVLHHVAEATVRSFLTGVAADLAGPEAVEAANA